MAQQLANVIQALATVATAPLESSQVRFLGLVVDMSVAKCN